MATYRFAVQHTGRPFGPTESIPADGWSLYSRHTTLSAARKATKQALADMRESCGPGAWDDHYRVVALVDTTAVFDLTCGGSISPQGSKPCPNVASTRVTVPWPAGGPAPACPIPDGWQSEYQCAACCQREEKERLLG